MRIKRFSSVVLESSKEIHEETIDGKTRGVVEISRGEKIGRKKPTAKTLRIKYTKGGSQ